MGNCINRLVFILTKILFLGEFSPKSCMLILHLKDGWWQLFYTCIFATEIRKGYLRRLRETTRAMGTRIVSHEKKNHAPAVAFVLTDKYLSDSKRKSRLSVSFHPYSKNWCEENFLENKGINQGHLTCKEINEYNRNWRITQIFF